MGVAQREALGVLALRQQMHRDLNRAGSVHLKARFDVSALEILQRELNGEPSIDVRLLHAHHLVGVLAVKLGDPLAGSI